MNHQPIDQCVRQVRQGDMKAFELIVRTFEKPIRGWIISRCPPGGDADEIAQETFLLALKQIDEYELGTNFKAWLFAIAQYQLMRECTRLRRIADYHARYVPHALAEELQRRIQASDTETIDLRMEHLNGCVDQLGQAARKAIDLRYAKELSLEEISQQLGRTYNGTKKYLCVLRGKIRSCIEQKMASEGV